MSGRRALLAAAFPVAAVGLFLLVPTPPPAPPASLPAAVGAGTVTALGLYLLLAGGRPGLLPTPVLLAAAVAVGASEEAIWRAFALARLAPALGAFAALALVSLAFAAQHYPAQGARGVRVHVLTGAVFGVLFLASGSLVAAAVAHALYNVLTVGAGGLPLPADPLLAVRGVRKRYGRVEALAGVDLEVGESEVVALLGPNGAGKTTLLDLVLGLRHADEGAVAVLGRRPGSRECRHDVAATPQDMSFPPTLRVREILGFVLAHHRRRLAVDEVLERFGLTEVARRQAGGLSGGQRRRLAVALAFAPQPRLAILDEPTAGLDVESRRDVWRAILAQADSGRTVLFTTHHLDEAEALATRIVVLARGRVAADDAAAALRAAGEASLESAYLRLTGAGA
ncbi:MAG TPA: ABC transporter ATP-binding protein [Gaiellaceae bacterium]|nr:ABC transporter ATP-binding protein [Gaiellaceae bacterium]